MWVRADLFKLLLLAAGEVEHLLCALEEHGTLRFRLGDVQAARENGDFRLLHLLHDAYTRRVKYAAYWICRETYPPAPSRRPYPERPRYRQGFHP